MQTCFVLNHMKLMTVDTDKTAVSGGSLYTYLVHGQTNAENTSAISHSAAVHFICSGHTFGLAHHSMHLNVTMYINS